jgi:hypothetical protein
MQLREIFYAFLLPPKNDVQTCRIGNALSFIAAHHKLLCDKAGVLSFADDR